MHPRLFFDQVVRPNVGELLGQERLRAAINSILSLDAFYGVLFAHLRVNGHPRVAALASDDKFKDEIAAASNAFRVVRDAAFSVKHGELDRPKPNQPRLVLRAADLSAERKDGFILDYSLLDIDRLDGNEVVNLELTSGQVERGEPLILNCAGEAAALLATLGL